MSRMGVGELRRMLTRRERKIRRENRRIRKYNPEESKAKIVIAAVGSRGVRTQGKVRTHLFFPPFCRCLAQCGIGSVYVGDIESLKREILSFEGENSIIINLVNETFDDVSEYEYSEDILTESSAVFNSVEASRIIRDKQQANIYLSEHGISMPSLNIGETSSIFSNARFGSKEEVFLIEDFGKIDESRYNTEFIDTTVEYGDKLYFTSIRLMCIGPHLLQIYVRARDTEENSPSVHSTDTPTNPELLEYLHKQLVSPNLKKFSALGHCLGKVLGPGFYSHDVLVENISGELYLSETGYKFFDDTYANWMKGVIAEKGFQSSVVEQDVYAGYAASVFVNYCIEEGFF